jgi:hypothetical protein
MVHTARKAVIIIGDFVLLNIKILYDIPPCGLVNNYGS